MDVGGIAKSLAPSASGTPVRTESLVSSAAVKTELAPEATARPVQEAQIVRFNPDDNLRRRAALDEAVRDVIRRHLTVDPESRLVVFQAVNVSTGELVRAVSDEALQRLRAYAREMREADAKTPGPPGVERVA